MNLLIKPAQGHWTQAGKVGGGDRFRASVWTTKQQGTFSLALYCAKLELKVKVEDWSFS